MDWRDAAQSVFTQIWSKNNHVSIDDAIDTVLATIGSAERSLLLTDHNKLKDRVVRLIQSRITEDGERGISSNFAFSDIDPDALRYIGNPNIIKARSEILSAIENLSTRAFEHFSVHVMKVNDIVQCAPLPGSKEEGIDFCGITDLSQLLPGAIWKNVRLRVLGQVKKTYVAQPTVRLFHTDLTTCGQGRGRAYNKCPAWFKESRAPLVGFIFAFGSFTRDATKWAKENGIFTKDARQLVEDLLNVPKETSGISRVGGTVRFNTIDFVNHFNNLR